MTRFADEAAAREAGFMLAHDPQTDRFTLSLGDREIGEAHYRELPGETLLFDHTVVHPEFRGTGLSQVLAHYALSAEFTQAHRIQAGCWFIAEYLRDHPELAQHTA